jgi:Uma2 family endonuclease
MQRTKIRGRGKAAAQVQEDGLGSVEEMPVIRVPTSVRTLNGFRDWAMSNRRPRDAQVTYLQGEIYIEILKHDLMIHMPAGTTTLEGFRKWAESDSFPERGRVSFVDKEIVIDMSPEEIETHLKVKEAVNRTVGNLNEELDMGEFFPDGAMVTNDVAGLANVPDGTLIKWHTYRARRVRLVPRKNERGQFIEVRGRPDWILEIVSRSSVQKDTLQLRANYHRARIPEYWLIDAREEEIGFQILVYRRSGYVAVPARDDWHRSRVFGRSFRLERQRNQVGRWQYKLLVRED